MTRIPPLPFFIPSKPVPLTSQGASVTIYCMLRILTLLLAFSVASFAQFNEFGEIDMQDSPLMENPQPQMAVEDFSDPDSKGLLDSLSGVKLKPNSYGITIYRGEQESEFRKLSEAEHFLKILPEKAVTMAVFYGHGAPGMMTLGEDTLVAAGVVRMLKGKIAPGSAVHLFGCNTSAVPMKISFNPLNGLSYLTRRILYYQGARLSGASKETAEEMWNEDMAYDVSKELKDVEVCGLATFGLVPERLIGKEKAKPGLVLGQWICYKNRQKVSASQ